MRRVLLTAAGLLATSVSHAQNTYHMRDFYPQAWDKVHIFGAAESEDLEALVFDPWSDDDPHDGDFAFTMHRIYFRRGEDWRTRWCPRIDDVKRWVGGKLYYSDTFRFKAPKPVGPEEGEHTQISPLGHLWADETMTVGTVREQAATHAGWIFEHSACADVQRTGELHERPATFRRSLAVETTDWSPYTDRGQSQRPIPVVRLDEVTCQSPSCDDNFREEWFFAYDETTLRYVPIHTKGYRTIPGQGTRVDWDSRLVAIEPR